MCVFTNSIDDGAKPKACLKMLDTTHLHEGKVVTKELVALRGEMGVCSKRDIFSKLRDKMESLGLRLLYIYMYVY